MCSLSECALYRISSMAGNEKKSRVGGGAFWNRWTSRVTPSHPILQSLRYPLRSQLGNHGVRGVREIGPVKQLSRDFETRGFEWINWMNFLQIRKCTAKLNPFQEAGEQPTLTSMHSTMYSPLDLWLIWFGRSCFVLFCLALSGHHHSRAPLWRARLNFNVGDDSAVGWIHGARVQQNLPSLRIADLRGFFH